MAIRPANPGRSVRGGEFWLTKSFRQRRVQVRNPPLALAFGTSMRGRLALWLSEGRTYRGVKEGPRKIVVIQRRRRLELALDERNYGSLLGGLILLAIWGVRGLSDRRRTGDGALDVLRKRLAAGEISAEDFQKTRKALGA